MEPLALMLIFGPVGTTEIVVVLVILLLLFGGRKIPELAKGLGKGITEFRRGLREPASDSDKSGTGELPPDRSSEESTSDKNKSSGTS